MGALVRGDRCSLEAEAVTVEVARRAAASVQTTLTAVTGGAIHGPELACADQGPSSVLGVS